MGREARRDRLEIPDLLRGLAALAVCWYHLSGYEFVRLPLLRASGHYGWLGVQCFFVISGFVIPYALHRAGYRVSGFGTFLAKRFLRLAPPYYATLAILITYGLLTGQPHVDGRTVLAHLFLANAVAGIPWFIDVFWTLAIEFQYYLVIGLCYPLLARPGWLAAAFLTAATGLASVMLPQQAGLAHHAPLFLFGIFVFRRLALESSAPELISGLAAAFALTSYTNGIPHAVTGLSTGLAILFLRAAPAPFRRLGQVSYSLYLTHCIAIGTIVYQGVRWLGETPAAKVTIILASLAGSFLMAGVFYRLAEEPAQALATRLRYQIRR